MDNATLMRRLDADGSTGADLSPGDPVAAAAAARIRLLETAANEVLRVYMPQFPDSRAVDNCLVGLAAAVAGS